MSDENDDVLAGFISAEIARPEDTEGQDEMRERLATTLGIPMPVPAPPPAVAEEVAKRAVSTASTIKGLVILAVGFGAGFGTHALLPSSTPVASVPVAVPAAPSAVVPSAVPSSSIAALPAVDPSSLPRVEAPAPSVAPAKSAHAAAPSGDAEAERLLLETARSAMRRGDAAGALALLRDHASRYPHGQLREERDGMTVTALGLLGRTEEAEKAAARFKKDYPMSLQGAAVPHLDAGH